MIKYDGSVAVVAKTHPIRLHSVVVQDAMTIELLIFAELKITLK